MNKNELLLTFHAPVTEFSSFFLRGMANRITAGFQRYKGWANSRKQIDLIKTARDRIKKYEETKNSEYLIDAANFLMAEFMYPQLEGAKFTGTDHDQSPGLIDLNGKRIKELEE